jgi:predicted small secreted protein
MRNSILTPIALGLALVQGSATLMAEGPGDDKLKSMYLKLADYVSQGAKDDKVLVSLSLPGVPIGKKGLSTKADDDLVFLNNTLDHIPLPSGVYQDSNLTYTGVYGRIMRDKQVRQVAPTKAEQDEIAALQDLLKEKSKTMKAYRAKEQAFLDALDDLNNAEYDHRQNNARAPSTRIVNAVNTAKENWLNDGYMTTVQTAMDRRAQLANRDGGTYWYDLNKKYQLAMDSLDPKVRTYPKPEDWGKGKSWAKFTWSSSQKYSEAQYSHKDVEAAAAYSKGGVSVELAGGWSRTTADAIANATDTMISVELRTVYVYRDWMDAAVFNNTNWNLTGNIISNGAVMKDLAGDMPLIVNKIVLARNLMISGSWVKTAAHEFDQRIHAQAKVSVGPFSCSGSYNQQDHSQSASLDANAGTISNPGIQVVAFVSTAVPKAPNYKP